ncbi:MAG TPA: folylpolyglutamate synthase/dihydrofolate synthase family protein [Xanthobacteraceae bacterium]|nr:folylpolyglutamate synthase/dihydrofolate synthase family protein [Xanthobacteraceae bacterium]
MTEVDAIIARLLSLHPRRIDLTLDRMQRILAQLGHPQRRLPPVIHVAGTNGKGSTIAFMRAVLEAAGATVHAYTSPSLVRVNERYRLGRPGGGALVSDAELVETLSECERINEGAPITVFEITTAVAFMLFARHPADVLLLEVGLGGRFDATNVIDQPLASVITSISIDHVDYLGDTITKIAGEKAGILKPGVPAIVSPQTSEAREVVARQAARVGAPLRIAGEDWAVSQERGRLVFQDDDGLLDLPAPRLIGRHQFDNAGTAIATLRSVGTQKLPAAAFEAGLLAADWPARLQRLSHGRLIGLVPAGSELWVDGGHNPDGGRAIAAALADLEERVSRPVVLVVGMLASKDSEGFLRNFAGLARRVMGVTIRQPSARAGEEIAAAAQSVGIPAQTSATIEDALAAIGRFNLEQPPRILATGSLYFAGEVLAANGTIPE